jgi:hypothetical protein
MRRQVDKSLAGIARKRNQTRPNIDHGSGETAMVQNRQNFNRN